MNAAQLVRMANQIGQFHESATDRAAALEGIATHIRRFWDPRMRREFLEHVAQEPVPELRGIVREAVQVHQAMLRDGTVAHDYGAQPTAT